MARTADETLAAEKAREHDRNVSIKRSLDAFNKVEKEMRELTKDERTRVLHALATFYEISLYRPD